MTRLLAKCALAALYPARMFALDRDGHEPLRHASLTHRGR